MLVDANVPNVVGKQVQPGAQHHVAHGLGHVCLGGHLARRRVKSRGRHRLDPHVALRVVHPVDAVELLLQGKKRAAGRPGGLLPCQRRRYVGVPELPLARLGNVLGFGEMRDAIRNRLRNARHHIAHADIGKHIAKQERIAVAHGSGQPAPASKQVLRMSNMYVPTGQTFQPF